MQDMAINRLESSEMEAEAEAEAEAKAEACWSPR
jgi:hypothetical protein